MRILFRIVMIACLAFSGVAFAYQGATVQNDDLLRKKASHKGKVLAEVHRKEHVEVLRCRKGWCLVQVESRGGWMPQANLWMHEPSMGPGVNPGATHPGMPTYPGVQTYEPPPLPAVPAVH